MRVELKTISEVRDFNITEYSIRRVELVDKDFKIFLIIFLIVGSYKQAYGIS